ncbi:NACHT domain-containing protein [Sphingobium algorifonticola]|uniref:NACHT domain-containing protein n=2 Tax=Sphingobium algorifonticola TaxID=2008318 RepID=A0A437J4T6_9SPHN|nr:NACHT domain-containing protein [Sphingobium algorifonticola]
MSTTEQGNGFRDTVAQVLRAAGFTNAETEVQLGHKNADVAAVWLRDEMAGEQRYAFETKAYSGSLKLGECSQFAYDYGPLIMNGTIDQAWLISRGPITPEGRKAAQSQRGLQAMTFAELQRRLLRLDPYLNELAAAHARSRLPEYYVRPETADGEDLEACVTSWLEEADAPPLFVLGPYGKGKSTFANHLAATMATRALEDPTARVPILVRLGEIADEQSLEGLLGKVLASQHRVPGYHFDTFSALNRNGRFLVIYDGFDEMKHGLTPSKFQTVLGELMKLDEGDARILVLGRDTAFHDDVEFRAVIEGIQVTPAGRPIQKPGRRAYRHVEIRGFTPDEARSYVERYFPIRAAEEKEGPATSPQWVEQRVSELISGRFDRLLERPVHAQMLCEIAVHPDQLRPDMSVYELFDSFVHYLLLRELDKRGRDKDFPIDIRRRFNASLAWWLWERGGASTTTLGDIPQSLCDEAARDISHSLQKEEMRRELIQGCLIEKGQQTIYFHRSIQEFLAAEHLIETDLLQRGSYGAGWLQTVTTALTPEVIEFVVAGANISRERRERALKWFDALSDARAARVSLAGFDLFIQLAKSLDGALPAVPDAPFLVWLAFFLRNGGRDFAHRGRNTFAALADMLIDARNADREVQAAILYALARTLFHGRRGQDNTLALAISALIPVQQLKALVGDAAAKKSERQIVRYNEDYLFWSLLRSWRIDRNESDVLTLTIDLMRMHSDAMGVMPDGFDSDIEEPEQTISLPVQALYVALASRQPPVHERDIDAIRPFFNDPKVRNAFAPVEIVHRQTAPVLDTPAAERAPRPKLGIRTRGPR